MPFFKCPLNGCANFDSEKGNCMLTFVDVKPRSNAWDITIDCMNFEEIKEANND